MTSVHIPSSAASASTSTSTSSKWWKSGKRDRDRDRDRLPVSPISPPPATPIGGFFPSEPPTPTSPTHTTSGKSSFNIHSLKHVFKQKKRPALPIQDPPPVPAKPNQQPQQQSHTSSPSPQRSRANTYLPSPGAHHPPSRARSYTHIPPTSAPPALPPLPLNSFFPLLGGAPKIGKPPPGRNVSKSIRPDTAPEVGNEKTIRRSVSARPDTAPVAESQQTWTRQRVRRDSTKSTKMSSASAHPSTSGTGGSASIYSSACSHLSRSPSSRSSQPELRAAYISNSATIRGFPAPPTDEPSTPRHPAHPWALSAHSLPLDTLPRGAAPPTPPKLHSTHPRPPSASSSQQRDFLPSFSFPLPPTASHHTNTVPLPDNSPILRPLSLRAPTNSQPRSRTSSRPSTPSSLASFYKLPTDAPSTVSLAHPQPSHTPTYSQTAFSISSSAVSDGRSHSDSRSPKKLRKQRSMASAERIPPGPSYGQGFLRHWRSATPLQTSDDGHSHSARSTSDKPDREQEPEPTSAYTLPKLTPPLDVSEPPTPASAHAARYIVPPDELARLMAPSADEEASPIFPSSELGFPAAHKPSTPSLHSNSTETRSAFSESRSVFSTDFPSPYSEHPPGSAHGASRRNSLGGWSVTPSLFSSNTAPSPSLPAPRRRRAGVPLPPLQTSSSTSSPRPLRPQRSPNRPPTRTFHPQRAPPRGDIPPLPPPPPNNTSPHSPPSARAPRRPSTTHTQSEPLPTIPRKPSFLDFDLIDDHDPEPQPLRQPELDEPPVVIPVATLSRQRSFLDLDFRVSDELER